LNRVINPILFFGSVLLVIFSKLSAQNADRSYIYIYEADRESDKQVLVQTFFMQRNTSFRMAAWNDEHLIAILDEDGKIIVFDANRIDIVCTYQVQVESKGSKLVRPSKLIFIPQTEYFGYLFNSGYCESYSLKTKKTFGTFAPGSNESITFPDQIKSRTSLKHVFRHYYTRAFSYTASDGLVNYSSSVYRLDKFSLESNYPKRRLWAYNAVYAVKGLIEPVNNLSGSFKGDFLGFTQDTSQILIFDVRKIDKVRIIKDDRPIVKFREYFPRIVDVTLNKRIVQFYFISANEALILTSSNLIMLTIKKSKKSFSYRLDTVSTFTAPPLGVRLHYESRNTVVRYPNHIDLHNEKGTLIQTIPFEGLEVIDAFITEYFPRRNQCKVVVICKEN